MKDTIRRLDEAVVEEFIEDADELVAADEETALSVGEVRHLMDIFTQTQKRRVALQLYANAKGPTPVVLDMIERLQSLEKVAVRYANRALRGDPTYEWLRGIKGVGPTLAALVMAYVHPSKFPSPAAMWAYLGLSPNKGRDTGDWNYDRRGKTIAFKLAISQIMVEGDYRPWYDKRKAYEWEKNFRGENAKVALARAKEYGKDTEAYLWASGALDPAKVREFLADPKPFTPGRLGGLMAEPGKGVPMIPPAHVEARARRWLAKLMLDHLWQVHYYYTTGQVWVPYVIAHKGHVDRIDPVQAPWLIKPVNKPWEVGDERGHEDVSQLAR